MVSKYVGYTLRAVSMLLRANSYGKLILGIIGMGTNVAGSFKHLIETL
jgi:hypothetical protein